LNERFGQRWKRTRPVCKAASFANRTNGNFVGKILSVPINMALYQYFNGCHWWSRGSAAMRRCHEVDTLNMPCVIRPIDSAHALAQRCKALTIRSAASAVISRLASHPTIATWVDETVGLSCCRFRGHHLVFVFTKPAAAHNTWFSSRIRISTWRKRELASPIRSTTFIWARSIRRFRF
jgi:hypothetical protein